MTSASHSLERLDSGCQTLIDRLAARPRLAAAVLLALALVSYLPGLVSMPPVDRTEVVYAQMARDMLASGDFLDAQYLGERFAFRPIGVTWMQGLAGQILGKDAQAYISTYRLPSLLGGLLAVLAVYWLSRPLIGARASLIAAGMFAVMPIVALQAQLSIPEGPLLAAATVAQLTLWRIYCRTSPKQEREIAFLFWAAQGFGMLINALAVPILSLSTIVALYIFDRKLSWLKRLHPISGVPLMALIAAPWILVRWHVDGVPFATLSWSELLHALGGAQDMKWKAAPLTFTLGLLLGALPAMVLLVPGAKHLWEHRTSPIQRFLFCWIVGYLAYLELIASKPALYTVQAMFPAVAAAAALVLEKSGRLAIPDYTLRLPAWFVAPGMAAVIVGAILIAGASPNVPVVVGGLIVVFLFTVSALALRARLAPAWTVTTILCFAAFLGFTFGVLLPNLAVGWPAARIKDAIGPLQRCVVGPVGVLGFREPSTTFKFGPGSETNVGTIASRMAGGDESIAVVEDRWHPDLMAALKIRNAPPPPRVGCVKAFNVMRGCPLNFSIYVTGTPQIDANCKVPPQFACTSEPPATPGPATSRCR